MKAIFWNEQEHRLRAGWRLALHALFFVLVSGILQAVMGMVAGILAIASGINPMDTAGIQQAVMSSPWIQPLSSLISLVVMILSYLVAARWLDKRRVSDFGFHLNGAWFIDFGFGLALGALLMVFIFLVERAAGWVTVTGTMLSGNTPSFVVGILVYVVVFICVGIYEEMLSRGYQLRNLAEGLNFKFLSPKTALLLAYVLSSAVFGLLHAGNPNATLISTFNIFLAGLFLGLGYVLTGELAIPIGLHMTWNFFQGNVFGFPVSGMAPTATFIGIQQGGPDLVTGGAFGPEAGLIGLAAMLLGSILTWLWVRWRRGQAGLRTELAQYLKSGQIETVAANADWVSAVGGELE